MKYSRALTQFLVLCLVGVTSASASDQIPGAKQSSPIAIVGATIHTVGGPTIDNGAIVFDEGKIVQVGSNVTLREGTKVINGEGKHVYPTLIEANSNLGLVEINSVRASLDSTEVGSINPNVRAAVAFNSDSELIPVNRANGILVALVAPRGQLLAGRSSLMMLDGWNWEDMSLKSDVAMHLRWPRTSSTLKQLETVFEQAARYRVAVKSSTEEVSGQQRDLKLESLARVLEGEMPLVASANSLKDITSAVAFAKRFGIRLIVGGGEKALLCADLLRTEKVPVIVSGVYRNPSSRHSAYDEAYTFPKRLQDANIEFCISAGGRFGASGIRNLPYNAATAAAYGLSPDAALESITSSVAKILGVEDRIGALEVGMDATLFVADGDILETPTQVETAFVQGREVDLDNKHQQLYRKYSKKYDRMDAETN